MCNSKLARFALLQCAMGLWVHGACDKPSASSASRPTTSPQRIISISPDATEMIGALGQARRLVAVSSFCIHPPEVRLLPKVGGLFDTNLELILKLRPDLVILRGVNRPVEALCEENQIGVYRDQTEGFDDIYQTLRDLGNMLECSERAAQVEKDMRARLDAIGAAVTGRPRPRVLMTLSRRPDAVGQVLTAGKGTFVDEIIRRAGGTNVFAELSAAYPEVSAEAILAAQPEIIIESMPETQVTPAVRDRVMRYWNDLGHMPAIKSGRIHVLSDENAQIPSPRIVEVVANIARLLHPEVRID